MPLVLLKKTLYRHVCAPTSLRLCQSPFSYERPPPVVIANVSEAISVCAACHPTRLPVPAALHGSAGASPSQNQIARAYGSPRLGRSLALPKPDCPCLRLSTARQEPRPPETRLPVPAALHGSAGASPSQSQIAHACGSPRLGRSLALPKPDCRAPFRRLVQIFFGMSWAPTRLRQAASLSRKLAVNSETESDRLFCSPGSSFRSYSSKAPSSL